MSAMFEFCCLRCEYAELHAPSSYGLDELLVVPFGATSSPFILNAVLQHHLKQHNTAVCRDMQISLYVDNIITGCDTEDAAADYYKTGTSYYV